MAELKCKNPKCRKSITALEKKLNAGLCDDCLTLALQATARDVAKRDRNGRGN